MSFSINDEVVVNIPEVVGQDGTIYPAEQFRATVVNPKVNCMISRLPGMEVRAGGETIHIKSEWATPVPPPVPRTPLTQENLLAALAEIVVKNPTTRNSKGEVVPETVEHLLAGMLLQNSIEDYQDYKAHELLECLNDWMWNGIKGYNKMTMEELLAEAEDQLLDNGMWEFNDLEDLLARFDFSTKSEDNDEDFEDDEEEDDFEDDEDK